jgi:hypothetical protein
MSDDYPTHEEMLEIAEKRERENEQEETTENESK